MKKYRVGFRFLSDDYALLEKFISDKKIDYRLIRKGVPSRPKSSTVPFSNILVTNIFRSDSIEEIEKEIIDLISKLDLENCSLDIKKEFWISSVNDTDQFGFELSNELLRVIAKNKLKLCISGVFV